MEQDKTVIQARIRKEAKCPKCGKLVSTMGMGGHMRFVHKTEIGNKKRPIESIIEKKKSLGPIGDLGEQIEKDLSALITFVLHLFDGDDKKLIKTVNKVKKEQEEG